MAPPPVTLPVSANEPTGTELTRDDDPECRQRPAPEKLLPRNRRWGAIDHRTLFFLCLITAASGVISPPVALAAGILFSFCFSHPLRSETGALARVLLQLSVVALGFGMNLGDVVNVGRSGFAYTVVSITASLAAGLVLGKLLRVRGKASFLIAAGTAICGGSAIAALAPVLDAKDDEISVAMGTVFVLNAVALFVFPVVGLALHLSQSQFGLWAALAIHDTSSVVGACARYGASALVIGTTVKLARALWIIPVTLAVALYMRTPSRCLDGSRYRASSLRMPWFILFFCLAAVVRTYAPAAVHAYDGLAHLGRTGLTATLFLIGTGLSRSTLRRVGFRPFLQGIVLWLLVASLSAWAICRAAISI